MLKCITKFLLHISGTKLGKGSYFATQASYSAAYTDCNKLFVARIIPGEFTQGDPSFCKPPPKDRKRPLENFYDSCVDDPNHPDIFVIFTHQQAYPEYILEY